MFKKWIQIFEAEPGYNDATGYGVKIVEKPGCRWRVIGVHHLTPDENRGKQNLFIDVLDREGRRINGAKVHWAWEGMRPEQRPRPLTIDKLQGETQDIAMNAGQKIDIWIEENEGVGRFHTNHLDQRGPNGEIWNSIGHHSFLVVFQEMGDRPLPPLPQLPPTPLPLPTNSSIQIIVAGETIFSAEIVRVTNDD